MLNVVAVVSRISSNDLYSDPDNTGSLRTPASLAVCNKLRSSFGDHGVARQRAPTRWARIWRDFHQREVATIPDKVRGWLRLLSPQAIPPDNIPNLAAVVDDLEELSYRLRDLVDAKSKPQADFVIRELRQDVRAWRHEIEESIKRLTSDEFRAEAASGARLREAMAVLEAKIEAKLRLDSEGRPSDQESENLYRFLGALRDVGDAVTKVARRALAIDWPRLREARF